MTNIQKYINAGFTTLQAKLIVGDLNDQTDRHDKQIKYQSDKHDKEIKELKKEIKELKGEILYLQAIIFHRQDLIEITPRNKKTRQLTETGSRRIEYLRKTSPWKNLPENQVIKNKQDLSERLHAIPPNAYKKQINDVEKKLQHQVNYEVKKRKNSPNFILPSGMSKNFPKKFLSARKAAYA